MLGQDTLANLLREKPVEAPKAVRLRIHIEGLHDQQIAGRGPFDANRAGEEMHQLQDDIADIHRIVIIGDLATGPVIGLDLELVARLARTRRSKAQN